MTLDDRDENDEGRRVRAEQIADHLDLPDHLIDDVDEHFDELLSGVAPMIWIQGQNCTGCTVALLNSVYFAPGNLGHSKLSLRYQPTVMSAEGSQATDLILQTENEYAGKYLLVLEGAVPTGDGETFCTFGLTDGTKQLMGRTVPDDRTAFDWLMELIPGAEAVLAVGNCASFGGIPTIESAVTGATGDRRGRGDRQRQACHQRRGMPATSRLDRGDADRPAALGRRTQGSAGAGRPHVPEEVL